jgi:hypothetical protein
VKRRVLLLPVLLTLFLVLPTCMFKKTDVDVVDKDLKGALKEYVVKSPAKLHLHDGGVILYDDGFKVRQDNILGRGERYDLTRSTRTLVSSVPVDEVAFVEHYDRKNRPVVSTLTTIAATAAGTVGTIALFKAIFGSCPTVYSDSGDGRRLQAELFSHSISSTYEMADLDRLDAVQPRDGSLSIEIANEALETHYINKVNLLVVDHPPGYEAFPLGARKVLLVGKPAALLDARSKAGDDIRESISNRDDRFYQSGEQILKAFTEGMSPDWIDLSVKVPDAARTMYVMVRVRNTLFATVFLYDVAMAQQGFYALDWMASDSAAPGYEARFGRWFNKGFGMTVQLLDGGSYRTVAQFAPTGPIAWKQASTGFPAPSADVARLRLSFTPDNWAIDWVGVSFVSTDAVQRRIVKPDAIAALRGNGYSLDPGLVAGEDSRYLVTYPGDLYKVSFALPPAVEGMQRSYFLASRGYYIEWMRMDWIAESERYGPSLPLDFNDSLLQRTARIWLQRRDDMQDRFYNTRLPLDGK